MSSNNKSSSDKVIKNFQLTCSGCNNPIQVPIKQSDLDSAIGGLFKMVAVHQCEGEQKAFVLFFDKHLSLRSKDVSTVSFSDVQASVATEQNQITSDEQFYTLISLYQKFNKDLGKVIFGMLSGQQIVVVGQKVQVDYVLAVLPLFAPHRHLTVAKWTDKLSSADIVGTIAKLKKHYPNSLILDLETNEIQNGYENKTCQELASLIGKQTDASSTFELINERMNQIIQYVQNYSSSVENIDEAETYFTALALDGVDQDILELMLPIGSELNPFIANYSKKTQVQVIDSTFLHPTNIWLRSGKKFKTEKLSTKEQVIIREQLLLEKAEKLFAQKLSDDCCFEYFTPSNHYIISATEANILITRFPRIVKDEHAFRTMIELKHALDILEGKKKLESLVEHTKKLTGKDSSFVNLSPYETELLELRAETIQSSNCLLMERHFILTKLNAQNLPLLVRTISESISQKFPTLQPKILRGENTSVLKETFHGLRAFDGQTEKVDVGFNIYLTTLKGKIENKLGINFELYLQPAFYKIAYEPIYAFEQAFLELKRILVNAKEKLAKKTE